MTNPEHENDPAMPPDVAIVAALLDGEDVDAAELRQALATPAGRDYLMDVLLLRRAVAAMGPATLINLPRPRSAMFRSGAAAAIVLIFTGLGGYALGQRTGLVTNVRAGSAVEAVVVPPAPRAPKPTQVIRLQPNGGASVER